MTDRPTDEPTDGYKGSTGNKDRYYYGHGLLRRQMVCQRNTTTLGNKNKAGKDQ